MTVVIDGTRTQALVKFGDGFEAWKRAREATYMIETCTPQQAVAHLAIHAEVGCVVRCVRGPKGGWANLSYIDETHGYGTGKFVVMCSKGWELHLGWLRSWSATAASEFMQHQLDAARYAALMATAKGTPLAYMGGEKVQLIAPRRVSKHKGFASSYGPQRKG